jgi:benzoyl-CoA 2,3-dioxygenase component A
MRRQRTRTTNAGGMTVFFGARSPDSLPYFGPLKKVPDEVLTKHLVFSRIEGQAKEYVQDRMRAEAQALAEALRKDGTHIYVCGLRDMEAGVEQAFEEIASGAGLDWARLRDEIRKDGRYHVETY